MVLRALKERARQVHIEIRIFGPRLSLPLLYYNWDFLVDPPICSITFLNTADHPCIPVKATKRYGYHTLHRQDIFFLQHLCCIYGTGIEKSCSIGVNFLSAKCCKITSIFKTISLWSMVIQRFGNIVGELLAHPAQCPKLVRGEHACHLNVATTTERSSRSVPSVAFSFLRT